MNSSLAIACRPLFNIRVECKYKYAIHQAEKIGIFDCIVCDYPKQREL